VTAPSGKRTRLVLFSIALCGALALFAGARLRLPGELRLFAAGPAVLPLTPVSGAAYTQTATPFQPLPTSSPTATLTPTHTVTSSPTATFTPLPSSTPLPPTATDAPLYPLPDDLPGEAQIEGVHGYAQAYNLTCEARSAVDWARFFGGNISEMEFQAALPLSDNPEVGFVGYYDDPMGRLPPLAYGAYAAPVAQTLAGFGVDAAAVSGYSLNDLRRQVASGNPVIVWVVGNTWWDGTPVDYRAEDGSTVTVVRFEHTVILTGYDAYGVSLVDGGQVYWRSYDTFLASWSVLGNMAVIRQ